MRHLATTLYVLGVRLTSTLENTVQRRAKGDSERGSVTIEQVIWAGASRRCRHECAADISSDPAG